MVRKSVIHSYLRENGIRQDWFAEKLGVTRAMMSNYANVRVLPSPYNLMKMHDMTKGKVSIDALVREHAAEHPEKYKKRKSQKEPDSV